MVEIAKNKSEPQILISFGENFPTTRGHQGNRGGTPAAIQLVRQMVPSGLQSLPTNTTLKTKVIWYIIYSNTASINRIDIVSILPSKFFCSYTLRYQTTPKN